MNIDKLVKEVQDEVKKQGFDNQYFFKNVLFSINENDELEVIYKDCKEKEQFKQFVNSCIANHDPTPLPPQKTQEDYLLDLDFRLSMIELGL